MLLEFTNVRESCTAEAQARERKGRIVGKRSKETHLKACWFQQIPWWVITNLMSLKESEWVVGWGKRRGIIAKRKKERKTSALAWLKAQKWRDFLLQSNNLYVF